MSLTRLWQVFGEYHDVLLSGIWVTVSLSILAMLIAIVAGLVACLGTLARSRIVRAPAQSLRPVSCSLSAASFANGEFGSIGRSRSRGGALLA